jgi:type II secretory ATPase GspE/PulE/Tfp pilus assembly ATPase PilB-like protein
MRNDDLERAAACLALTHKLLTPGAAIQAIHTSRNSNAEMGRLLLDEIGESALLAAIATELDIVYADLYSTSSGWRVDEDLVRMCDIDTLKSGNALPLRGPGDAVGVALANPRAQQDMVDYLRSRLPANMQVVLASVGQIQAKLVYFEAVPPDAETSREDAVPATPVTAPPATAAANPVVNWVDNLLARAAAEGASDVPFLFNSDGSLLVRFRVDGMMRRQTVPLRRREREIVGSLLAKCPNIDASDRTRPQDGTFSFPAAGGRQIDTRLGMLPQAYGPTIVVRLLDPQNINRRLEDMGFARPTLEQMRRIVRSPQGAVLFIGPTGSGKTTTLYGLLKELPALELNILTAEDPIEYRLPHLGQTQIRGDLGAKSLTFARALRAMLRLDPDVILVGEIRDSETAETAMQASMTGHLVLSTLHAKSSLGAFPRLEELGVEPFLASEALSLAVNQRLLRRVHECAARTPPTASEAAFLSRHQLPVPDQVARLARAGCPGCNGTGYRGRLAVVEVLEPTVEVRELVASRAPQSEIFRAARLDGYTSIVDDAFRHVLEGRTTVAELLRCIDAGAAG